MMRLKLIGAVRASFKGAISPVTRGNTCDVDDNVGQSLLSRTYMDAAGVLRPLWELVKGTEGDSAASLDTEVAEEEIDAQEGSEGPDEDDAPDEEEEVEEDEEETPAPAPKAKPKAATKRRAAPKKARTRKPPTA